LENFQISAIAGYYCSITAIAGYCNHGDEVTKFVDVVEVKPPRAEI